MKKENLFYFCCPLLLSVYCSLGYLLRPSKSATLFGDILAPKKSGFHGFSSFVRVEFVCHDFGKHCFSWRVLKRSQVVMADWDGITGKGSVGGYGRRSMRDEDFEEEDVWSLMKEREDSSPRMKKSKDCSSGSSSTWRLPTAPRMIPRSTAIINPPSTTATQEAKVVQQSSAPVKIPDWSKIYGKNSRMDSWADDGIVHDDHGDYHGNGYHSGNVNDNEDDVYDDMVPPHEWIARKLARSQISSFSMCEGIGRTLKGRDLSKVRNAILTKTGFLE